MVRIIEKEFHLGTMFLEMKKILKDFQFEFLFPKMLLWQNKSNNSFSILTTYIPKMKSFFNLDSTFSYDQQKLQFLKMLLWHLRYQNRNSFLILLSQIPKIDSFSTYTLRSAETSYTVIPKNASITLVPEFM